jgi:type I restriction enzyme S subunit
LKPQKTVVHKYFRYLLKSKRYISGLTLLVTGIREGQNIDTGKFKDSYLPLPPKPEQTAIAIFLDYKLEKIARFIKKKKQLVSLLTEQKAAIINQAVTKGLNPNAKLRPSNIEWLGNIPEQWEVKRMKYLGEAIIGLTYSPTELVNAGEGTLVLRSSNVQNGNITYDDCVYVTTKIPDKKRTRKGDILICSRNGSIKLIGKNTLIDDRASNESFGAFMTIFRSKNHEYLHYFFNSSSFKAQSGLFSTSTINQLTTGILNNIIISIPRTLDEQLEVVNFIKIETEIIEKTISTIEKEIDLVEEYKTALIAEAVTGKIDVRGFKVPMIEEPLAMVAEDVTNYNKAN